MCGKGKKLHVHTQSVETVCYWWRCGRNDAVMPVAAAEASAGPASAAPTHVIFKQDPGGAGCDANGNCGSGGQNGGPGGAPGGQGCVAGVGCGSGGQNAGPGGVPGGQGCIPGTNLCGSGHA